MKSPEARHMGVPTIPLTDLYNAAGAYIRARGGELRMRSSIETFRTEGPQVRVQLTDKSGETTAESTSSFDYLVLALPFDGLDRVLPVASESAPLRAMLAHFEPSPITGIHLWFDRQISDLDHAVLLDRTIQWMFHKSRLRPMRTELRVEKETRGEPEGRVEREGHDFSRAIDDSRLKGALAPEGSYIELVVSASKTLIEKSRSEIVDL